MRVLSFSIEAAKKSRKRRAARSPASAIIAGTASELCSVGVVTRVAVSTTASTCAVRRSRQHLITGEFEPPHQPLPPDGQVAKPRSGAPPAQDLTAMRHAERQSFGLSLASSSRLGEIAVLPVLASAVNAPRGSCFSSRSPRGRLTLGANAGRSPVGLHGG